MPNDELRLDRVNAKCVSEWAKAAAEFHADFKTSGLPVRHSSFWFRH